MGKSEKDVGFREVKEVMPHHVQRWNLKAYDCPKKKNNRKRRRKKENHNHVLNY